MPILYSLFSLLQTLFFVLAGFFLAGIKRRSPRRRLIAAWFAIPLLIDLALYLWVISAPPGPSGHSMIGMLYVIMAGIWAYWTGWTLVGMFVRWIVSKARGSAERSM